MRAARLEEVREPELCEALGVADAPVWLADGYNDAAIIELADEQAVRAVQPDFVALRSIRRMAVVTPAACHTTSSAAFSCLISASTRTR